MRHVTLVRLAVAGLALASAAAFADPVGFVVNHDDSTISVVDLNANTTVGTFSTAGSMPSTSGRRPTDAIFDAKSGRLFVAGDERLMGYDGRAADGRGLTQTPVAQNPTSLAFDEVGRRIFMSHKNLGFPDGLVTEISIADPLNPVVTAQRAVRGFPDLAFVAWDPKFRRVYAIDIMGNFARTDSGPTTWNFMMVGGVTVPFPTSVSGDATLGGLWSTTGFPGRLIRILENGSSLSFTIAGANAPHGIYRDPAGAELLVALEDKAEVKSFDGSRFNFAGTTDLRPIDVGKIGGKLVTANKVDSNTNGTVTVDGTTSAIVGEDPVALALGDVAPLFVNPSSYSYCYNQLGDSSQKTFAIQNTRVDRANVTVNAPTPANPNPKLAGANPANYAVTANGCSGALAWGATCSITVGFLASGTSVEPPPPPSPIGGPRFQPASWPAELRVTMTGAPSVTIALRASLSANRCPGGGPLLPH